MTPDPDNAEQIEFWNGPGADRWVKSQEVLDRTLEPFGRAALLAAGAAPGERVVDVGCGCGWTALALADAVGAAGFVLGIDVSAPMIGRARERAGPRPNLTFEVADATTHPFDGTFDLLFSRFGVMFFRDPTAAFTNLRRALRPRGRVAFICWAAVADNPWFGVPMAAAVALVLPPEPSRPDDPGPFAFADAARVERVLRGAGFSGVTMARKSIDMELGPNLDAAVAFAIDAGPVSRLLVGADEETVARVRAAIRRALEAHAGPRGVLLPASTWIVSAQQ